MFTGSCSHVVVGENSKANNADTLVPTHSPGLSEQWGSASAAGCSHCPHTSAQMKQNNGRRGCMLIPPPLPSLSLSPFPLCLTTKHTCSWKCVSSAVGTSPVVYQPRSSMLAKTCLTGWIEETKEEGRDKHQLEHHFITPSVYTVNMLTIEDEPGEGIVCCVRV